MGLRVADKRFWLGTNDFDTGKRSNSVHKHRKYEAWQITLYVICRGRAWTGIWGMCGLYKTTCIMTVLSVTICLIILHFTTGLKVLPTGDQTNNMMTQVAEVTVKGVIELWCFYFYFIPEDDWYVKKVKSSSYPYTRWRTRRGGETEGFSTYFYITFNIYILYYF